MTLRARHLITSDEAHFHLCGYVNKQNCRFWVKQNSQLLHEKPLHVPRSFPDSEISPDLTSPDYFLWGYPKEKVYCTPTRRKAVTGICLLLRHLLGLKGWIILQLYRQFKKHALSCMLFPVWRDMLLLPVFHYEKFYPSYVCKTSHTIRLISHENQRSTNK